MHTLWEILYLHLFIDILERMSLLFLQIIHSYTLNIFALICRYEADESLWVIIFAMAPLPFHTSTLLSTVHGALRSDLILEYINGISSYTMWCRYNSVKYIYPQNRFNWHPIAREFCCDFEVSQIAKFMWPTWGPPGSCPPGGRLNKKDGLTRYGDSHVKDKTS